MMAQAIVRIVCLVGLEASHKGQQANFGGIDAT
jgi:hypothetical protein